jgi:hypothetical protein
MFFCVVLCVCVCVCVCVCACVCMCAHIVFTQVLSIVAKEPRLLWTPNVDTHVSKVLSKLIAIYPYETEDKRADVIKLVHVSSWLQCAVLCMHASARALHCPSTLFLQEAASVERAASCCCDIRFVLLHALYQI